MIVNTRHPSERIPGPEPKGRVCAEPDCDWSLSTYNPTRHCTRHHGWIQTVRMVDDLEDLYDLIEGP